MNFFSVSFVLILFFWAIYLFFEFVFFYFLFLFFHSFMFFEFFVSFPCFINIQNKFFISKLFLIILLCLFLLFKPKPRKTIKKWNRNETRTRQWSYCRFRCWSDWYSRWSSIGCYQNNNSSLNFFFDWIFFFKNLDLFKFFKFFQWEWSIIIFLLFLNQKNSIISFLLINYGILIFRSISNLKTSFLKIFFLI